MHVKRYPNSLWRNNTGASLGPFSKHYAESYKTAFCCILADFGRNILISTSTENVVWFNNRPPDLGSHFYNGKLNTQTMPILHHFYNLTVLLVKNIINKELNNLNGKKLNYIKCIIGFKVLSVIRCVGQLEKRQISWLLTAQCLDDSW